MKKIHVEDKIISIIKREEQGKETIPTLYFQRKLERPYHIDYVFGAQEFCEKLQDIKIGQVDKWLEISDHMPILCEFENDTPTKAHRQ